MRMLNIDLAELKDLGKITRKEASQFLEVGEPIVCRTSRREFHEISSLSDLEQVLRCEEVYDLLEFYIK